MILPNPRQKLTNINDVDLIIKMVSTG